MKIKFLILAICLISISSYSLADNKWRKYESGNFIVYSDHGREYSLREIRKLELFKQAMHRLLSIPESTQLVPFEVYLFESKRDMLNFAGSSLVAGYYQDRLAYPVIAIGAGGNKGTFFHEYVHFLTFRQDGIVFPPWYREGIAVFYSTAEFKDGKAIFGATPQGRRDWIAYRGLLDLKHLIEPKERFRSAEFTSRYYATAWLLAHRIMLGTNNGMESYSKPFKEYLLRYNRGERSAEAFFDAFGKSEKALEKDLNRYASKGLWEGFALPVSEAKGEIKVTNLSVKDTVNIKVRLALANNKWDYAEEVLRENESDLDGEGRAVLAIIAGHASEEPDNEEKLIGDLVEDQDLSGVGHAYLGHALFDLAEKKPDMRKSLLFESARHLEIARDRDALFSEGAVLPEVYWQLGKRQSAVDEILRLMRLNPASIEINLLAGEYFLKAGLDNEARFFLNRVVDWAHSEEHLEKATQLLAKLESSD